MNHIEAIIESLKSVLCDPKGNCCLRGSDADRAVVDVALAALASISQQGERVGVLQDNALGLGKVFWFKKPADGSNLFVAPQPAQQPVNAEIPKPLEIWEVGKQSLQLMFAGYEEAQQYRRAITKAGANTMTDKELLELAAKAAGFGYGEWVKDGIVFAAEDRLWNPLRDDGDALRLAVKLRLDVEWLDAETVFVESAEHVTNNDPYAATRRAVVRAAAEIGKAMP